MRLRFLLSVLLSLLHNILGLLLDFQLMLSVLMGF